MKITVEFELPAEVEGGNVTDTIVAIAESVPGKPTIICKVPSVLMPGMTSPEGKKLFHDVVMTYKPNKRLG